MITKWVIFKTVGDKELTCSIHHPILIAKKECVFESSDRKYKYTGWKVIEAEQLHSGDCVKTNERVVDGISEITYKTEQAYAYDAQTETDTLEINGIWSN